MPPNQTPPKLGDTTSSSLQEAERTLKAAAQASQGESLDSLKPKSDSTTTKVLNAVNTASDSAADNKGVGFLLDGVNTLIDGLPSLVKALDEISKIHPYIGSTSRRRHIYPLDILLRSIHSRGGCFQGRH